MNPSGAAIACATAPRIVFIICKIMDIKELYALYRRCSCVTTDSRHCPENSLFIALKGASSMAIVLPPRLWRRAVAMPWLMNRNMPWLATHAISS